MTTGSLFPPRVYPGKNIKGRIAGLFREAEPHPETATTAELDVDFEGIPGSRHHGFLRRAGPREPWYGRGTHMRSGRQITLVSTEDMAALALDMGLDRLDPGWIGSNVVTQGIPSLSWLPAGTRLVSSAGVVLVVEGQNAPCRIAGKAIMRHVAGERAAGLDLAFAKLAVGRRGLVASVERPGTLVAGETVIAKVGRQWIYPPA
jgi:hypothetical protein